MNRFIQIVTTIEHKSDAEMIASELLEKRLVACVQVTQCRSTYRWQGKIEQTEEYILTMKSRSDLFGYLEGVLRKIHPYDVPEIIATEIKYGNKDYLAWLNDELAD